jgi:hypothetical protein
MILGCKHFLVSMISFCRNDPFDPVNPAAKDALQFGGGNDVQNVRCGLKKLISSGISCPINWLLIFPNRLKSDGETSGEDGGRTDLFSGLCSKKLCVIHPLCGLALST